MSASAPQTAYPQTVADLARLLGAEVEGDAERRVRGPAGLQDAGPDEVSFLANAKYVPLLATTRAGAVVVGRAQPIERAGFAVLRVEDPNRAFTRVVEAFAPPAPSAPPGVHPSASIDPAARVSPHAHVGPGCVVEAEAEIAAGAVLRAQVFVGTRARVGERSWLHPGVVIGHDVQVGADCVIHAGCVLGADGYGFERARDGWTKIPQCGTVIVEDHVEIGANCAIDRARFGATRIGRGAKLDNLVHVAHNVVVGERVLLVAQVGIAGSARIGDDAMIGGQAGIAGHVSIAAKTQIGAGSGVQKDILDVESQWFGTPARLLRESARDLAPGKRIQALRARVAELEARLDRLTADGEASP